MEVTDIYKRIAYISQEGIALKIPYHPVCSNKGSKLKWMVTIRFEDSVHQPSDTLLEVSNFGQNIVHALEIGKNNAKWDCLLLRKV